MQSQFQSGTLASPHTHRELRRILLIFATIWVTLLGGASKVSVVRADSPVGPTGDAFLPLQFAMADFDGDFRPDLASIESTPSGSAVTNYLIELRLTNSGLQSISLVAPAGGLRIEARDVNGDHAVDLIFATAWLKQPVAVLLNDGHGRFSQAKPEAFPAAFRSSSSDWSLPSEQARDAFGIPSSSNVSRCHVVQLAAPLSEPAFDGSPRPAPSVDSCPRSDRCRAPPPRSFS